MLTAGLAMVICLVGAGSDGRSTVPAAYRGTVISHRNRMLQEKLLAITIDDGPDAKITPRMLDALRERGARATFFVLGQSAARHPELLRRMVHEGHAIGSHTWDHALRPSRERAARQLEDTARAIFSAVGFRPQLFRPPGGIASSWTTRLARQQGYAVVMWTISGADTATRDPITIANNIIHTPNPGDIALIHDSATKRPTAEALPRILDELGREGWRFVTIPELLKAWDRLMQRGRSTLRLWEREVLFRSPHLSNAGRF